MSSQAESRQQSRMLFVKNLNYNVQGADLYELFGRYGAIRQVRIGDQAGKTKGTAFVVFEEIGDAKKAMEHLNGFHLQERYIVVLFHIPSRTAAKADLAKREADLERLKQQHDIKDE
ncbi:hypothetical protein CBS101457_001056 [Exobasidium rhododendri]|nr:hypothetical protein CBS101457_001056 [Exobasidium rhododendri]